MQEVVDRTVDVGSVESQNDVVAILIFCFVIVKDCTGSKAIERADHSVANPQCVLANYAENLVDVHLV